VQKLEINFNVVVTSPPCNCALVKWDAPTAQTLTTTVKKTPADTLTISHGTVNAASLQAEPAIRICNGICSSTTTIKAIVDKETNQIPSFMSLSNGILTVNSQSNSDVKNYELKVTMTTPDSGDQVFETVKVVLNVCVITHLDAPTQP